LYASILAGKGVPLVAIQDHLRHDHLSTTERYIHKIKETRSEVNALTGLKGDFSGEGPKEAPKKLIQNLQLSANSCNYLVTPRGLDPLLPA
jgi:hypothetical protein